MSRAGYIRRTAPFNNVLAGDSVIFAVVEPSPLKEESMPPSKPPMPKHEQRAYHEAGHAVLAARFEIGIEVLPSSG